MEKTQALENALIVDARVEFAERHGAARVAEHGRGLIDRMLTEHGLTRLDLEQAKSLYRNAKPGQPVDLRYVDSLRVAV